ncbi:hypothetical protein L2K20_05445 [Mycobacterium sp. MBM]|nr:hypothetical protein [Mycobacterium sp. MBM]
MSSQDSDYGYVPELRRICHELIEKRDELEGVSQYLPALEEVHAHLLLIREKLNARGGAGAKVPPDEQIPELRYFGWALFEAALVAINKVEPAYTYLPDVDRDRSRGIVADIAALANLARATPWPEFSIRGLGALRSLALAHSKGDSGDEYKAAWTTHAEVDNLLWRRADEIESGRFDDTEHFIDLKRDLDEMWQQHDLSQTGTSCREPEYSLCRWVERVKDGTYRAEAQEDLVASLAHRLRSGIRDGQSTINRSDSVYTDYYTGTGIPTIKDEKHLLVRTSMQNPGIMTARAYLLLIPMCPLMASYEHLPFECDSWDEYQRSLIDGFVDAYGRIENPPGNAEDQVPYVKAHLRSLVQHRLFFRIICPDRTLPSRLDENVLGGQLDLDDVEDLSSWLTARGDDANVISSATLPEYIRGIEMTRAAAGIEFGYRSWRRRWPQLDRFHKESDRGRLVAEVLGGDID